MQEHEKVYTTKEISMALNIGTSTLRKWCLALEENAYQFTRDDQNGRSFIEGDIVVLKQFQYLVQKENFKLENASKVVASRYIDKSLPIESPPVLTDNTKIEHDIERSNELLKTLLEKSEKQEQFNKELLGHLNQQQKYIEERLSKRDELLIQSLKESIETKQLIAAAKDQEERPRKGFWSRLFGK